VVRKSLRFSARTRWNLAPNRWARVLEEKRRAGVALLDLTESNPTRARLPGPPDILHALASPAAAAYAPDPRGQLRAREAVSADYERRGCLLHPDQVVLTASSSEAYAFLFKLLCDPGDRVLVPRPSYPLFDFLAGLESVEVDSYPLRYDGEWHLSADAARAAIRPRTRAIVVVHPNNPTGSFLKAEEAEAVKDLAARNGIAVVSDEVFADFAFGLDPRRVPTLASDGPCLAFSLGGLSKACGLPQLKLGWIAVSGPAALRADALARLEVVADTYLSVGTPVQEALPSILARRAELHGPIAARVRANRDALARRLDRGSAVSLLHAEGGWSAVLHLPVHAGEEDWAVRLLEEADLVVHPGYFFEFDGEGFVVASLLTPPEALAEGASRILSRVDRA